MSKDQEKFQKEATQDYLRQRETFVKLARKVEERSRNILRGAVRANFQNRAKSPESFQKKLKKEMEKQKAPAINHTNQAVEMIRDLAGVRVLTYDEDSRQRVTDLLTKEFEGSRGTKVDVDKKDEDKSKYDPLAGRFYRSTHLEVCWPHTECVEDDQNLLDLPCEIQVTSLLAHVWNELEHDIVYKPDSVSPSESQEALLKILGGITVAGDGVISELLKQDAFASQSDTAQFTDPFDFGNKLTTLYPDLDLPDGRTGQLLEVVQALDLGSPKKLTKAVPVKEITDYQSEIVNYNTRFTDPNDRKVLNVGDSDVIAYALAKLRGKDILEIFPTGRGTGVPLRVHRIARHLSEGDSTDD